MDGYEDVPKATQEFEKANQKLMQATIEPRASQHV
jgi:hypothetical protein